MNLSTVKLEDLSSYPAEQLEELVKGEVENRIVELRKLDEKYAKKGFVNLEKAKTIV